MRILYIDYMLYIQAESDFERGFINAECFKSKIAFKEADHITKPGVSMDLCGLTIVISIDGEIETMYWEQWAIQKRIFLIRRLIDAYLYRKHGALALHAAALVINKRLLLFYGGSACGKSFLTDKLFDIYPQSALLGDDHIIVDTSARQAFGNQLRRLRDSEMSGVHVYKNNFAQCAPFQHIEHIHINLSSDKRVITDINHITKYLTDDFDPPFEHIFQDLKCLQESYTDSVNALLTTYNIVSE